MPSFEEEETSFSAVLASFLVTLCTKRGNASNSSFGAAVSPSPDIMLECTEKERSGLGFDLQFYAPHISIAKAFTSDFIRDGEVKRNLVTITVTFN